MKGSIATRYAVRSLGRNVRRTLLSCLGVGIGCTIGLIAIAWVRGEQSLFVRAAAESGAGHLRVIPAGWLAHHDRSLRLHDSEAALRVVAGLPGLRVAAARVRSEALLAMGTHVASVELVGVDPRREPAALRFVRHVQEGRYLLPGDRGRVVVGKALAKKLHAQLGDALVATIVGNRGEMRSAMLEIVGLIDTGSRDIDLQLCQVTLPEAQELTGRPGIAEITILLSDPKRLAAARTWLEQRLPRGDRVAAWFEIAPELRAGVEIDAAWAHMTVLIVLLVVLLGVASAQLSAMLERRRELAVLAALGTSDGTLVRLVLVEGVTLGAAATVIALAFALPVIAYLALHGLNLQAVMGEPLAMNGVLVDPIFHADIGPWLAPYAAGLALTATTIASIYPAWFASRTDPASALRVAQ